MDNDDQSDAFTPYIAEPEIIDRHAAGSVRAPQGRGPRGLTGCRTRAWPGVTPL
jgi:hypothetical protein